MSDRFIRITTSVVVLAVAAFAAAVSFGHIFDLAHHHGQDVLASSLLPLSVDGTVLASSLVMLHAAKQKLSTPHLARFMLALGVAATVACNVVYGLPYGPLGALLSAWPAVAFIGSAEMAIGMVRSARRADEPQETYEVEPVVILRTFAKQIAEGITPTIREIKAELNIGQPKAAWVRDFVAQLNEAA